MNALTYVLENGVGLIQLHEAHPNPDLVNEKLGLCCREADECVIHLLVQPGSTVIGKILLFFKTFCQEKGKELRILCADHGILAYIRMLRIDQLITVDLMEK